MRILLTNLLLLFTIIGAQAQQHGGWFRSVNVKSDESYKDVKVDENTTIRFFKGEWVETVAEKNGDIIVNGNTLPTDAHSLGAWKSRTQDTAHSPLSIVCTAVVDTISVEYDGADSIACMVINQSRNDIISQDFSIPGKIVISNLQPTDILRIAPENRVSTVVKVSDIIGYGELLPLTLAFEVVDGYITVKSTSAEEFTCSVRSTGNNKVIINDFKIPGRFNIDDIELTDSLSFEVEKHKPYIVSTANIIPDRPQYMLYIYIGVGVLGLLLITGALVWFIVSRKRTTKHIDEELIASEDSYNAEIDGVEQRSNDGNNQSKKPAPKYKSLEEMVKLYERKINEITRERDQLSEESTLLKESIRKAENRATDAEQRVESISKELQEKYEQKIAKLNEEVINAEKRANERIMDEQKKHEEEIVRLNDNINKLRNELTNTQTELSKTTETLHTLEAKLKDAYAQIQSLNSSLTKYNTILTDVPFAKEYAALVSKLLVLSNDINRSALGMLELNVDDPYNLMKYISRYAKTLSTIDMQTLNAELKMLEMGNMVLVASTLATYDKSNSEEDLQSSTLQYFFTSYMQKMIDGLVVLNESMAGSHHLVDGVTEEDVKVFIDYRTRLQNICEELGIVVENVRLFDKVGEKIDLSVKLVDIGLASGDIVDMENAIVYLAGSRKPDTKVRVKVQE